MRLDDLVTFTHATPFVPFRIQMVSGSPFYICHPNMIKVGRTAALIFTYPQDSDAYFDKFEMVSLTLMESMRHTA